MIIREKEIPYKEKGKQYDVKAQITDNKSLAIDVMHDSKYILMRFPAAYFNSSAENSERYLANETSEENISLAQRIFKELSKDSEYSRLLPKELYSENSQA